MAISEPRGARKGQQFLSRILRAAHGKKQANVGEALGWDDSKTSRVLSGERAIPLDEACDLLAECGLALIDAPDGETVTVSRAHYQALVTLAGERAAELQKEAGL